MRNKALAACVLALVLLPGRAAAVEPVPGGSCAGLTANSFQWAGGPENSGVTNGMFCNGTTWSGVINFQSSGKVGIGTSTPADSVHIHNSSASDSAGLTISTPGTGTNQQSTINLVAKGTASATLGTAGVQGWQIWVDSDANTYGPAGGANAFGIGYADNTGGWGDAAFTILPGNLVGVGKPNPQTDFDVGKAFALSGDVSPPQLTANKNNYNPTGMDSASVVRLTSDASRTITGLTGGTDGRILTVMNVGSNPIVLANQNASSSAANRFAIGADITLGADQSASLIYDTTSQRWRSASLPFDLPGYFVQTATKWNGNLGGLSGADAKCLTELQTTYNWKGKSSAGTLTSARVHAFLCDGTSCNNLQPNTFYMMAKAGSTTAGGSAFKTDASGSGPGVQNYWDDNGFVTGVTWASRATGSAELWGTTAYGSNHCTGWSSTTGNGRAGEASANDSLRWSEGNYACSSTGFLYCLVNP